MNELKVFSVEEANGLIPALRLWIHKLREQRNTIAAKETEIDALELVTEKNENGESPALVRKVQEHHEWVRFFYESLDKMNRSGCQLKDLDTGLVDFYTMHEGRLVYLCWACDEDRVSHWHEIGGGYAARQPLLQEDEGV